jgi:hypothetical protein
VRNIAARLIAATTGLAPENIALIVAVGLVLGTFPVYGCPTLFCAAAALVFRLNAPALQVINQIATPAQFALLLPLSRVGVHVIGQHSGLAGAVAHAVAGWCCMCVPAGALVYFLTVWALRVQQILPRQRRV